MNDRYEHDYTQISSMCIDTNGVLYSIGYISANDGDPHRPNGYYEYVKMTVDVHQNRCITQLYANVRIEFDRVIDSANGIPVGGSQPLRYRGALVVCDSDSMNRDGVTHLFAIMPNDNNVKVCVFCN